MRQAEQFCEDDAGLGEAVVVGLQAGEDEIELLILDRSGERLGSIEGVEAHEGGVFEVNGAIGTLGEGLAQDLLCASRAGGDDDNFTAVLFFLAECFLEGVGVGLVHLVGDILADPGTGLVEFERCVFLRHLLHADQDFHPTPRRKFVRLNYAPRARKGRHPRRKLASINCFWEWRKAACSAGQPAMCLKNATTAKIVAPIT